MDIDIYPSVIAACVSLIIVLSILAVFAMRKEPRHLQERAKNGEILLLTYMQVMALYDAAPEKWDLQVDGPIYYLNGKGHDGLLVFMLPKERKRYREWFDWRLSHGEEERRFQVATEALCSMQDDLNKYLQEVQDSNRKALLESAKAIRRVLGGEENSERKEESGQ